VIEIVKRITNVLTGTFSIFGSTFGNNLFTIQIGSVVHCHATYHAQDKLVFDQSGHYLKQPITDTFPFFYDKCKILKKSSKSKGFYHFLLP
jgi:hypothetical protein